jgi:hypothetical protein
MPGRIFFRDGRATVTSSEFIVGKRVFPLKDIRSARGFRRRSLWPLLTPNRFTLVITTATGECEVLQERNGYIVFQLAQAIEAALKERNRTERQALPPAPMNSPVPRTELGV